MLKVLSIFLAAALLASCNNGPVNPSPQPPQPPQPQPNLSYPYNPSASVVASSDPRVPYYGDWAWAVVFPNEDAFVGKMSFSKKLSGSGFVNAAGGAAVWCVTDFDACSYSGSDAGVMGTFASGSQSGLAVGYYRGGNQAQVKFAAVDLDGQITLEPNSQRLYFGGVGEWIFDTGASTEVVVVLLQVDADPEIKLSSLTSNLALPESLLKKPRASLTSASLSLLEQVGLERIRQAYKL